MKSAFSFSVTVRFFASRLPPAPNSGIGGKMLAEAVPMGSNLRGSAAYRTHLAAVLGERCFARLTAPQKEEV